MPSRNSISGIHGLGIGSSHGAGNAGSNTTGRVSYLQVQTTRGLGDEQKWGERVVLVRDREGGWVVVDADVSSDDSAGVGETVSGDVSAEDGKW